MQLARDMRLAIRRLFGDGGTAITAILTLAVGIGGCSAMYAVVRAVLLKSMDISAPGQLVVMWPQFKGTPGEFSLGRFQELRLRSTTFSGIALTGSTNWPIPIPFEVNGVRVHLMMCPASGNFFDVLGAQPSLGRTFTEDDDQPGAAGVVVLSDHFWRSAFGADPAVVGRKLGGATIIGVMPPDFFYPAGADVWEPAVHVLAGTAKSPAEATRIFTTVNAFHLIGRLKPGVTLSVAQAEISSVQQSLLGSTRGAGDTGGPPAVALTPLADHVFGTARRGLWLLMGSVTLVLAIACANVAGLLVARSARLAREFSVRAALGASRWQLARHSVIDAFVLATVAGALGLAFAVLALPLLIGTSPTAVVRLSETRIDFGVVSLAIGATTLAVILIAVVSSTPLWRGDLARAMKSTSTGLAHAGLRRRLGNSLVVAQVAISVVLFVCATLTVRSVGQLATVDLGYDATHVLVGDTSQLDQTRYAGYAAVLRATDSIISRASALPGVTSAAALQIGPFAHGSIGWDTPVLAEGQAATSEAWRASPLVNVEYVSPRYFETMGMPLISGRDFSADDRSDAPPVVVVSDTLAARLWPSQNAVGRRLRSALREGGTGRPAIWLTVVGVVHGARYREIDHAREDLYTPLAQGSDGAVESIVVRTSIPQAMIPPLGSVLTTVDPQLNARNVTPLEDIVRRAELPWRFNMVLFVSFSVIAVGLTGVALVGVTAASVSWRRREIGVRVAVGAGRRQVVGLILSAGIRLVMIGLTIGVVITAFVVRLLSSLLFGITTHDPGSWIAAGGAVCALCFLACYLPARRAGALDPCVVFRED